MEVRYIVLKVEALQGSYTPVKHRTKTGGNNPSFQNKFSSVEDDVENPNLKKGTFIASHNKVQLFLGWMLLYIHNLPGFEISWLVDMWVGKNIIFPSKVEHSSTFWDHQTGGNLGYFWAN